MDDPYTVLGVARDAGEKEIQAAYRALAKAHHPDLNPGQANADRFKRISAAYDLLKDAEKRKAYDEGRIDAGGNPKPPPGWRGYAEQGQGFAAQEGFAEREDLNDFLRDIFGRFGGDAEAQAQARRSRPASGRDVRYTMSVGFREACEGAQKQVQMPDGRTLAVNIPAGTRDRAILRLRGQGAPGYSGGPPGDAYIEILVEADPLFERKDDDIHAPLSISILEAALGGKVEAPTLSGPVMVSIPQGANSGTVLRLKGKGVRDPRTGRRGDHYVKLRVVMPKTIDPELASFLENWGKTHRYDPRGGGP
jgi:DnaJ-class molecular chaperone